MHFHGYLWTGDKAVHDKESVRRPPSSTEPASTSPPEVIQRYREAVTEWRVTGVPPMQTAHWLLKPAAFVRGTWDDPERAAAWLGDRLVEHAPRFAAKADRGSAWQAALVAAAAERLGWGGDVSHGFYLERPVFLSLALVTCSPNRAMADQPCPAG
ncbi:hypothetical protein [Streptomyces roseifaciens]|uniref:hypothetical protein n=1 Tax=Streptomyces roseifaciens TaxID=1488406 RepID=UPI000717F797|nr:hypothetical protein [Streptomyces roseifaciens]